MSRKIRSPRFPVNNQGKFARLVPFLKAPVVPGETMQKGRVQLRCQSLPIKYPLTGAYVEAALFFVPFRLVVPELEAFWLGNAANPLSVTAKLPVWFNAKSALFKQCYQEVVNFYYRTDEDAEYSAGSEHAMLLNPDLTGEAQSLQDFEALDETIDAVTGGLTVREIDKARADLRYAQRQERMTGRYTDFLGQFGVNARDDTMIAPERLGSYRKFVHPSKSVDQSTGYTVQSYFHDVSMRISKRKRFNEYGFIIGVASIRPKVMLNDLTQVEELWTESGHWPHPKQPEELRRFNASTELGDVSGTTSFLSDSYLRHGAKLSGAVNANSMHLSYDATTVDQLRLPGPLVYDAMLSSVSTLPDDAHFEVDGVSSLNIATPLDLVIDK